MKQIRDERSGLRAGKLEDIDLMHNLFATLFHLANRMQKYLDKYLSEDGLTGKQFMLMIVLGSFPQRRASLKKLALRAGTSYQNVKKLALNLQKLGFVKVKKGEVDGRTITITMTDKAHKYWMERDEEDIVMIKLLFANIKIDDLQNANDTLYGMLQNLEGLENEL